MLTFIQNIKCQGDNSLICNWGLIRILAALTKEPSHSFIWDTEQVPRLLNGHQCVFKALICCLALWFVLGYEAMWEKTQPQKRFKMAVILQTSGLKDTVIWKAIKQTNKKRYYLLSWSCDSTSEWWITCCLPLRWCHFSEKNQWTSLPLITLFILIFNCVESELAYRWVF